MAADASSVTSAAADPSEGGEILPKRPRLADSVTAVSAGGGDWAEVISRLQPAIVALKVTAVRSFEDDPASTIEGTGFVVDHVRGIILTNRHIIGVGPVRATATFDRHEELEVEALYRDPVHDFGFFRYNPSNLRLTRCAEIQLAPDSLTVGTEIRVIGNDAGEKLQILSGTIARVDRNVPEFNTLYNDENTFYAGAGAGTSGGSSGSPVLNKDGKAIALNAAGQEGAASSYFLPLHRVERAFRCLQKQEAIPRGTCLATFLFKPFDELVRVGLSQQHEIAVRSVSADTAGLLIVANVLCEQKHLKTGDILLRLEGKVCTSFVELEIVMDSKVSASVQMLICRGGEELNLEVPIENLHKLLPRSFVELGLDTLHVLGYHAGRHTHMPLDSGMYLAKVGHVFGSLNCGRAALITHVGKMPTRTPEELTKALAEIPHREYFQASWYELADFRRDRTKKTGYGKMSRAWFPLRLWTCQGGEQGGPECWVAQDFPMPTAQASRPLPALGAQGTFKGGDPLIRALSPSLVSIRFRTDRRFCTEASPSGVAEGSGLLVDAERGIIITDRHSVPQSLGDVEVTLAGGAATVDAEVLFIHPLHNFSFIRCDPEAFKALRKAKLPMASAILAKGAKASLRAGESVNFVGYDHQGNVLSTSCTVAASYLPSGRDEFPLWDAPRFRVKNMDIVVLADTPEEIRGGVLCDAKGTVRAAFLAFDMQDEHQENTEAYGVAVNTFAPVLQEIIKNPTGPFSICSLDAEMTAVDASTLARGAGAQLPKNWLRAIGQRCGNQGQVARGLRVNRLMPTGAADGILRSGDVLLSIADQPVTCCLDVDAALAGWRENSGDSKNSGARGTKRPSSSGGKAQKSGNARSRSRSRNQASSPDADVPQGIPIGVFRDGSEIEVRVRPAILESDDASQLLMWAGLVLRPTPRCVLDRCGEKVAKTLNAMQPGRGVIVQHVLRGSPGDRRELHCMWFLVEVQGQRICGLEDVLKVLPKKQDSVQEGAKVDENGSLARKWIRLRLMDTRGQEHVRALQCDPLYFPTFDLRRSGTGQWKCERRQD